MDGYNPWQRITSVAVIGTTSWGTTLAALLARKGVSTSLWARTAEEAALLQRDRENRQRLPGIPLPPSLNITSDLEAALAPAGLIILAVPSQTMRSNLRALSSFLRPGVVLLSAAKGLEVDTAKRMSEVIREEIGSMAAPICVLSGPNLSREIATGQPTTTVVAGPDLMVAQRVQEVLLTSVFRVYTHTDVVGVELGGALKNIIAIDAGLADGLGYGANGKAAFITRGLAEITRLGVACGANPLTFAGLAGLGDLIATCYSPLSRNHYVGEELAKGRKLDDILASIPHVAEGINTTIAALKLAARYGVEMPISEKTYQVLFEGLDPRRAVMDLLLREPKHELSGIDAC